MKATVPGTNVGLLTVTSKMPCKSWSLPAVRSCPSAYFGPEGKAKPDRNAICGACYASKGMYAWPAVKAAQDARFAMAIQAAGDPEAGDAFVDLMTDAIRAEAARQMKASSEPPVFRVHDSGDLFSPAYARLWARICHNLPHVKFWVPTRQWRSKNLHMLAALLELAALPNVAVRPSALNFDDAAPVIDGLAAGTTASHGDFTCPAPLQGGNCRDCRACWDGTVEVSYRKH